MYILPLSPTLSDPYSLVFALFCQIFNAMGLKVERKNQEGNQSFKMPAWEKHGDLGDQKSQCQPQKYHSPVLIYDIGEPFLSATWSCVQTKHSHSRIWISVPWILGCDLIQNKNKHGETRNSRTLRGPHPLLIHHCAEWWTPSRCVRTLYLIPFPKIIKQLRHKQKCDHLIWTSREK